MKNLVAILLFTALTFTATTHANSNAEFTTESSSIVAEKIININLANVEELMALHGVGQAKAEAIIDYRRTYGDFKVIEELKDVKGIGEKLFEKNRARISL